MAPGLHSPKSQLSLSTPFRGTIVTVTILTDQQPVTKMYSPKLIYDGTAQSV